MSETIPGQVPAENEAPPEVEGSVEVTPSGNSTIEDLDTALKEIEKLRKENAAKRVANKEKAEELEEFKKWKDSQKTELERLADAKAALEKEVVDLRADSIRSAVCRETKLDPDLWEFVSGADEDEMRAKAVKLAEKAKPAQATTPNDTYAGNRGTYVAGSQQKSAGGLFLESLAKKLD